jgi:hypothetical protein
MMIQQQPELLLCENIVAHFLEYFCMQRLSNNIDGSLVGLPTPDACVSMDVLLYSCQQYQNNNKICCCVTICCVHLVVQF